jgi:hypothetical protein
MHTKKSLGRRDRRPTFPKISHLKSHVAATSGQRLCADTVGELSPNAECVELIRDAQTGLLKQLVSDGGNSVPPQYVEYRRRVDVPADPALSVLQAITWPQKCTPYESTEKLFSAVRETFRSRGFPEHAALQAAYFTFPTWFPECVPAAPCLLIAGPRPEASFFLQLLGCAVRHALWLGEVTRGGFCSLPMDLQLTLLVDLEYVSRSARSLLSTSNNRQAHIPRKSTLVNVYCAKAIYCGDKIGDSFFDSTSLRINLTPFRGPLPIIDARARQGLAEELQAKFLAYRQKNIAEVRASGFDLRWFSSDIRILARVLGACLVDAPELQAGLDSLLRRYEEDTRAERWFDARCVAIEALLFHCHAEKGPVKIHVGKIACTASTILKGRGLTSPFDPKAMGVIVRSLGLSPRRDSKGYAIRLTDSVRQLIHQLARDFDVAAVQDSFRLCSYCSDIFVVGDNENKDERKSKEDKPN